MAPEARRVVVCDSDLQSVRALRFVLRGAGFGVDPTYTAEEALDRVAVRPPDAAIVELVLRDVLREGREVHLTPIEYQLLRVLILERGRLITHTSCCDRCGEGSTCPTGGRCVRTSRTCVTRSILLDI